jgi:hypothetical protein
MDDRGNDRGIEEMFGIMPSPLRASIVRDGSLILAGLEMLNALKII